MTLHAVATIVALRKMFAAEGWFDICTTQELWRLHHVTPDPQSERALRLLHCVHWKDVPSEVRVLAGTEVLRSLGMEPTTLQLQG